MRKNKNIIILSTIIILLPIIAGLILWNQLPEMLPIHWNYSGEVDGWSNKIVAVFLIPIGLVFVHIFSISRTLIHYGEGTVSKKIMYILFGFIPVISIVCSFIMYSVALGLEINVSKIVYILVGFIFIILGNYLPKNRPNNIVGFRIPWTLNNEENWIKTNRLGGKLFVLGGFLYIISALVGRSEIILIVFMIIILVPFIYSYMLHRKIECNK